MRRFQGETLPYVTVEPDGYDSARSYPMAILLHGYGSHMGDLAGLSGVVDASGYVYAMPNAPIEIPLGYGMVGYAWKHPLERGEDSGVRASEERLEAFFDEVMAFYGVGPGNAVLGGFSQGAMMTYHVGLAKRETFRGLVCLSGAVMDADKLRQRLPADRDHPIFISHGKEDAVIPVEAARLSLRFLKGEGYAPEYREYEMGHEINAAVLNDLTAWLHRVLPPGGSH